MLAVKNQGVHGFTLDPLVGEFILTKPYMRIPEVGPKVSCTRTTTLPVPPGDVHNGTTVSKPFSSALASCA